MDDELLVLLQGDWGVEEPDSMDVGIGHLQGPAGDDVDRFDGAVIAGLAMGGIGEEETHGAFFALGIRDAEARGDIAGGVQGERAFRDVDTDRGDGRGGRCQAHREVFAFGDAAFQLNGFTGRKLGGHHGHDWLLDGRCRFGVFWCGLSGCCWG